MDFWAVERDFHLDPVISLPVPLLLLRLNVSRYPYFETTQISPSPIAGGTTWKSNVNLILEYIVLTFGGSSPVSKY